MIIEDPYLAATYENTESKRFFIFLSWIEERIWISDLQFWCLGKMKDTAEQGDSVSLGVVSNNESETDEGRTFIYFRRFL